MWGRMVPHGTQEALRLAEFHEDAHNDSTAGTSLVTVNLANTTNVFAANVLASSLADYLAWWLDQRFPEEVR